MSIKEFGQAFQGLIFLIIGLIILIRHKTLVKMVLEAQKGVDKTLENKKNRSGVAYIFIASMIFLIIGSFFILFGIVEASAFLKIAFRAIRGG